jgi:glycosyltransferase involved in cell wall biosynthesis
MPFDEIIIIDDASSDESPKIIEEAICGRPNILFLRHPENLGQLAAFESGIMKSKGDVIFFLDADDIYAPHYLETAISIYRTNKDCRFLFCNKIDFRRESSATIFQSEAAPASKAVVTDLGYSLVRTFEEKVWIGAPTSCLSVHRRLARKLFPLPIHEDWRIRADDCIVFGASLAGCRKFRLEARLVGYRIHGNNAWANNKSIDRPDIFFSRQVSIVRLFNLLCERFHITRDISTIAQFEFKTIPAPSFEDLVRYSKVVIRNGAKPTSRILAIGVLVKWFLKSKGLLSGIVAPVK